jgi:hypothetical protein
MSDPNFDQAATTGEAPDEGTGTPDSKLTLGTAMVGGPVDTEVDDGTPIDPDTGEPVGDAGAP